MNKKLQALLWFLAFLMLLYFISAGGPWLSKKAFEKEKESIDKNGLAIKAIIKGKRQFKGHLVSFSYVYKSNHYTNEEQDENYYDKANIGDSINVKIDTLNPVKSYILK